MAEIADGLALTEPERAAPLQHASIALIGKVLYSDASPEQTAALFPPGFHSDLQQLLIKVPSITRYICLHRPNVSASDCPPSGPPVPQGRVADRKSFERQRLADATARRHNLAGAPPPRVRDTWHSPNGGERLHGRLQVYRKPAPGSGGAGHPTALLSLSMQGPPSAATGAEALAAVEAKVL